MQPAILVGRDSQPRPQFRSARTARFTESVIREMSRLAMRHGAVNLAQGFPDFPAPTWLKEAACTAILDDVNQYAVTWGAPAFRRAIATKQEATYGTVVDPDREVTVCCGSTEGMIASLLAVTNPGDEIVLFEPYYENYHPDTQLCGAERRLVRLHAPTWEFDPDELRRAFTTRTKAIVLTSPHNPTGKVFRRDELAFIAELCQEHDVLAITDEIYEHITYDGAAHIPMATLPGMRGRTITVNSMSKTYSVTGWRVGWVLAPPDITDTVRKVHDFLTVGAAAPLQQAGVLALQQDAGYYAELASAYEMKRSRMLAMLERCGFQCAVPQGAYYVMARFAGLYDGTDVALARHLVEQVGVAAVPGSSFFADPGAGAEWLRFCFCKNPETLAEAERRLARL